MFVTRIHADSVEDRSPWGDFWFEPVTVRSASGMRVSAESAMRLSAVYRCVRVLGGTMASLPLCFYRPKDRGKERITKHWLLQLLTKRTNRWQNAFEWHEMMVGHIALRGTAYNRIIPDGRGGVSELLPLHPDRMSVELLDSGKYRYRYRPANGEPQILPAESVFKVAGLSSNGLTGMAVIEYARESIGEGIAQQDYSARFFANDARPTGGWIEYPAAFRDKPARDLFRESWQQAQAGTNRGKTAVLENGMKYHELGISNKDAQFLEAKNAKVPDICRWFGVPPHLAFALDRATNNNIEQLSLEFIKFTMTEWAERFEAALEDQLLVDDDDLEVEYDMDNLARGDMKSRGEFYQLGINGGWMTRNEAREREGLDPLDKLDEPLQPLNMVPAGTEPAPAPGTPLDDPAPDDEADARARALTLVIAGRVVRKETAALRKAFERAMKEASENRRASWDAAVTAFYNGHVDYVVESLLCPVEIAAAWCDRQLEELGSVVWEASLGQDSIPLLLEAWEASAAAELAARVSADVCTPDPLSEGLHAVAAAIRSRAPASVKVDVGGATVNVPERSVTLNAGDVIVPERSVTLNAGDVIVPERDVQLNVRGYPLETEERVKRSESGEIERVTRKVIKE